MDTVPTAKRSAIMSSVGRRNTGPEVLLRRALHSCGLRFTLPVRRSLPGSPDVVFPAARVAVFVDGCFWHGCPLHATWPKTNADFWAAKIERNRQRDREVDDALASMAWISIRVWEHEVVPDPTEVAQRVWAHVRSRQ